MPSKPRTLAGILHPRRHADAEYNRARRTGPDRSVEDAVVSSARWKVVRALVLRNEPLCRGCVAAGRTELATTVDHILGVTVAPERAYDPTNLQPLCTACHAWKSASERRRTGVDPGVGGTSSSHASAASGGARGVSRFSRVTGNARNGPQGPEIRASRGTKRTAGVGEGDA